MPPIVQPDQDNIRVTGDVPEPEPEETQSSKPIIGIIYPPPEVRNIVDKTASFVGRNGPEFEARIRQNEINNSKFNFLNNTDPYHAYYRHKVKEFIEGKAKEPVVSKLHAQSQAVKASVTATQEKFVLKDPPAPYEFIADPPSIAAYDLDVVRLTALFVARNGRIFLTQLMQREAKNYQFDFLRPQHSLFQYFTKLVEQYTKILIPPTNALSKLKEEIANPKLILDEVRYRVEWTKHEDRLKEREKQAVEKERLMYAQIDWHDFVVVETVDFQIDERGNFPRPVKVDELGARLLQQERIEKYGEEVVQSDDDEEEKEQQQEEESEEEEEEEEEEESEEESEGEREEQPQLVDMDMEESSEEEEEPEDPGKKAATPQRKEDVIIRKYDPKSKAPETADNSMGDSFMVSPITGEKIPAGKIQEHMRYGLLDPNWKELKRKQMAEKQEEEEVFAGGMDIGASLKGLAERRTDIFGVEETAIGKKVGEEDDSEKDDSVGWDGYSSSMGKTQREANQKVTPEEQLHHIQKTKGLLVDENLEKIGPKTTTTPGEGEKKEPAPVPKPVTTTTTAPPAQTPAQQQPKPVNSAPPVANNPPAAPPQQQQQQQQVQSISIQPMRQVLTPVVMRPMMTVPRPNPSVLVVQQQMPVQVRPPQPQLIAVQQRPQMVMQQMVQPMQAQMVQSMQQIAPPQMQPQQMQQMQQQQVSGEPAMKRARTEADLVPADVFLQQNNGPVTFRVQCPMVPDKTEWNLQGQMLSFSLPLTDEVSVIKAKIHEATGMPAGKQKLQLDGIFIKDSNSLAHYNMTNMSCVVLQVKERGGRRK